MTTIYIVRHGYSIANEKNLFLGHGDMDLTEKVDYLGDIVTKIPTADEL